MTLIFGYCCLLLFSSVLSQGLPIFVADMNQLVLSETTKPGTTVYTLIALSSNQQNESDENANIRYFIKGSDVFLVNSSSGEVTLNKVLDRETSDIIRLTVGAIAGDGSVEIPITVIVSDENDNPPKFSKQIYEGNFNGTNVVNEFIVSDIDLVGDIIEVTCADNERICPALKVESDAPSASSFRGRVVLRKSLTAEEFASGLDFSLAASDGVHVTKTRVRHISDGQSRSADPSNLVYTGPTSTLLPENANAGSLVLTATVENRQGDLVSFRLVGGPVDVFEIDSISGEIRTTGIIDRESLALSGFVTLLLRIETSSGKFLEQPLTIIILDDNDEPPQFNQKEYFSLVHENLPPFSPLGGLNIVVLDRDSDQNAMFELELIDSSGLFSVEPKSGIGSANIGIRLSNSSLDYENPNRQMFILQVVARETSTTERLSSTCTVTVTVQDENDNSPMFEKSFYALSVSEEATNNTDVGIISAIDRDSGVFGPKGFRYELLDNEGHDSNLLFRVDILTGQIKTQSCPTPGRAPCLDYETRPVYFLTLKVTDDEGRGNSALVSLRIDLRDTNDNPPRFNSLVFHTSVDEGATKFDPPFKVSASDDDFSSTLTYTITGGDPGNMFHLDPLTGEVRVMKPLKINSSELLREVFVLDIQVTDGVSQDTATLNIAVRDINDNAPVFEESLYNITVPELIVPGFNVTQVVASDVDFGENSRLTYRIIRSSYNKFAIDSETGVVRVVQTLDYEKQNSFRMLVVAVDNGWPALTGTTTLLVNVLDLNNHPPRFVPVTQHTQVVETAALNTVVHKLTAMDLDARAGALRYSFADPVIAVDRDGREIRGNANSMFKRFFGLNSLTGEIFVLEHLDRGVAAVVSLTVVVTDTSANSTSPQEGKGLVSISILDVNEHPPVFNRPWSTKEPFLGLLVAEEQPVGSVVGKITATDPDSPIERYEIQPLSTHFAIDEHNGIVTNKLRLDFESSSEYNFTVVAYDAGIPPLSSTAQVTVTLINVNDQSPVFTSKFYEAQIPENSPVGTVVLTVSATDGDAGSFGLITYSLTGENAKYFTIDASGTIKVADPNGLDRERSASIILLVAASDLAPPGARRTTITPVEIQLEDMNDNEPKFLINTYRATVAETVPLVPSPPIVQITAVDRDVGVNSALRYSIISGNEDGFFRLDSVSGILYPEVLLVGKPRQYTLTVEVRDLNGTSKQYDRATVLITVQSVNQHKPVFKIPSLTNATVRVPENAHEEDYLVLVLKADDEDPGDNGRISYHIRVGEQLVQETAEFKLDPVSGELRSRLKLDREIQASYELLLVAKDQGGPTTSHETLRLLTVIVEDEDDNKPIFPPERRTKVAPYRFQIEENVRPDTAVGQVQATDSDAGINAKIYYHIIDGNEGDWFYVDRTHGFVYNRVVLDREKRHQYSLLIKATNDPLYVVSQVTENDREKRQTIESDPSVIQVHIDVVDVNDNAPSFYKKIFYTGVDYSSNSDKLLLQIQASDPDSGTNGSLSYFIRSSNLYHMGSNVSSGSVVPSPFHITPDGRLFTDSLMAEYNQDQFVLEIVAREEAAPFREDAANVHVWVYEPNQLARVVVAKPLERAISEREAFGDELRNATQLLVVIDEMRHHMEEDGSLNKNMTDVYVHGVDRVGNNTIASVPDVLRAIDLHYDVLRSFNDTAIVNVLSATASPRKTFLEPAIMAIIALLIVLFVGFFMVIFTCCCIRNWDLVAASSLANHKMYIPPTSSERHVTPDRRLSVVTAHGHSELINSTENPLWIDKHMKPYEEQELSMRVNSDSDSPNRPGALASNSIASPGEQPNPYATIQKPRRALPSIHLGEEVGESSDYATIGGRAAFSHRSHDPHIQMSGAAHLLMTPEGEPILVADLI